MIDPFSVTGALMIGGHIANRNTCRVCKQLRLFSKWLAWTCCDVQQWPEWRGRDAADQELPQLRQQGEVIVEDSIKSPN